MITRLKFQTGIESMKCCYCCTNSPCSLTASWITWPRWCPGQHTSCWQTWRAAWSRPNTFRHHVFVRRHGHSAWLNLFIQKTSRLLTLDVPQHTGQVQHHRGQWYADNRPLHMQWHSCHVPGGRAWYPEDGLSYTSGTRPLIEQTEGAGVMSRTSAWQDRWQRSWADTYSGAVEEHRHRNSR